MNGTLIRREEGLRAIVLPENTYMGLREDKHIYKDNYDEKYYAVYKGFSGTWTVDHYAGDCGCGGR